MLQLFVNNSSLTIEGSRLIDPDCGDLQAQAETVDLNGDGSFEVVIQWGNACTSGLAGRSLTLIDRDSNGNLRSQLGFPALGWTALETLAEGWPDLSFGGPGFCHPVWRRMAGEYRFQCNVEEMDGGCAVIGNRCPTR